jgi:4-hydroxybenzoyl-CoA reductase subunit alpha
VQGAIWMGMGQAICEETQYHEGLPVCSNMLDYRIPTIVDTPPIEVFLIESMDPLGPFGAKEASEGGLHGFPPAFTSALHDALGVRFNSLPVTPDRVFDALQVRRRELRLQKAKAARQEQV